MATVDELAHLALQNCLEAPGSRRYLISVSGIPGSGMAQLQYGFAIACVIGMDGFHLSRKVLDSFPVSAEAHRRRGAPFTFDVKGLYQLVERLKEPVSSIFYAPSFDHAVKDPQCDDIAILPSQKLVIFEGNYLCFQPPDIPENVPEWSTLPSPLWSKIANLFDERWVLSTPLEVTTPRLALRHLEAGIVKSLNEGYERAHGSDKQNAEDIIRWRVGFDRMIPTLSLS
ncbi:hypothetical protein TWF694_002772 [Orbilia ellipsospora]|uniref:Uncharacterized protein n=1 Tax=Orbilia ellipsospora TaxID=2528407 RepID=A0AAV9WZJ2_9PEZI